jgi:hypothetical protein
VMLCKEISASVLLTDEAFCLILLDDAFHYSPHLAFISAI